MKFNSELFAHQLAGHSDFSKVHLSLADGELSPRIHVRHKMREKFSVPLLRRRPKERFELNRASIEILFQLFGQARVLRIGQRYAIRWEKKWERGAALRVRDLRRLLVGLADVRKEDVAEYFALQKNEGKWPEVDRMEDLSITDFDSLINELIPFKRTEEIFLFRIPEIDPNLSAAGVTFDSRQQAILLLEQLRRNRTRLSQREWAIRVAKRLTNAQLPLGTLLPHPDGYYTLWGTIAAGGAYKDLWQPLVRNAENRCPPLVTYRGTRMVSLAKHAPKTTLEDLRPDLGCRGVMETYEATREALANPAHGFVRSADERVWGIGMSLGGAHLQRDACLFLSRFAHIITVSSVGIDEPSLYLFKERADRVTLPLAITHIVDIDDVVPELCDGHIGVQVANTAMVTIEHYTYEPLEESPSSAQVIVGLPPSRPPPATFMLEGLVKLGISLRGAHQRETYDGPHRVFKLSNQEPEQRALLDKVLHNKQDQQRAIYEVWRRRVARFGRPREFISFAQSIPTK